MFTPTSKKAGSGASEKLGRSVRNEEITTSGLPSGTFVLEVLGQRAPGAIVPLHLPTSPIGKTACPKSSLLV
ncbi:MAG: hypothetical protein AVDCRST_MAG88-811 [uncultured Thermomicrobiales bacterium]|uniref:Uncharacterized protein n=1 Tax=uncultured Thermomicrobiales bacterium TaxID=1645740 RepID=A0A6J4UIA1_9BACT|nr:MAG: hypothetical protein AVDCRST_MAG88-811 [uncultured Thermomicrobiales bacterium]